MLTCIYGLMCIKSFTVSESGLFSIMAQFVSCFSNCAIHDHIALLLYIPGNFNVSIFLLANIGPINCFSVSLKFLPSSLLQGLNVYSYIGEYFVIFLFCKWVVYTFQFSFVDSEFFLWICGCSWIFSCKSCPKHCKYVLPINLLPLSRVCQIYKNSIFYLK